MALFPWLEIRRLRNMIDHITDVGIYPAKVIGGPHPYETRSEWQNGWNAATKAMIERYAACAKLGWKPPKKEDY